MVSGRVMIDAVAFRERNLSYFFPRIDEKPCQDSYDDVGFFTDDDFSPGGRSPQNSKEVIKQRTYTEEDLKLCKPTGVWV